MLKKYHKSGDGLYNSYTIYIGPIQTDMQAEGQDYFNCSVADS